jgi:hypothetical protein
MPNYDMAYVAEVEIETLPMMIGVSTEGKDLPETLDMFLEQFGDELIGLTKKEKEKKIDGNDIGYFVTFVFGNTFFQPHESQREIQSMILGKMEVISKALGNRGLAIFMTDETGTQPDDKNNFNLITQFGLESSKTPHIIITTVYPYNWNKDDDESISISLNRIRKEKFGGMFGAICDAIRDGETPSKRKIKLATTWESIKKWFDDHRKDLKDGSEIIGNITGAVSKIVKPN